jgi:tripartite-type tricarboxylate transporter receptor subunit TctC
MMLASGARIAAALPCRYHSKSAGMKEASVTIRQPNVFLIGAACAGAILIASAFAPANAQNYPNQPIKIVVPFVAGGGVDGVARIIAPRLSEELGQTVVIENRGGAGGAIAAAAVAKAAPDGYTFLFGTASTHGTNPSLYPNLGYDALRDFVPVVHVANSPLALIAAPSLGAQSINDLIALARAKPGELSFGSYGIGSINHLYAELFNAMAGIRANHIPYRGAAPAMTDLMAGRLQYTIDGIAISLGPVKSGTIRLLGVGTPSRSRILPDYPTIAESGLAGFESVTWSGLFAPAGTPKTVVDLINRKVNGILAAAGFEEAFTSRGIEVGGGTPEAFAAKTQSEIRKWTDFVRAKNIRIDQ